MSETEKRLSTLSADDQEKKVLLPKPPLFTSDYIAMAEILNFDMERFGQLILALMYYTTDGTMPDDLPPDMKMMFAIYQRKIDAARKKYENKCTVNAQNGSKGGRPQKGAATAPDNEASDPPKLKPLKEAKSTPKIKMPPPEVQFIKLLKEKQAEGAISEQCDPAGVFEWAEMLNWKVNNEPAQNVGDFLAYAEAKYPTEEVIGSIGTMPQTPKLPHAYGIIFKEFHGLRDADGNTGALIAAINFLKAYDNGWNFHGQTFTDNQWKEALSAFMQDLKTE